MVISADTPVGEPAPDAMISKTPRSCVCTGTQMAMGEMALAGSLPGARPTPNPRLQPPW